MYDDLVLKDASNASYIQNSVRQLAEAHADELAAANRDARFPREIYREMGKLGLLAPFVDRANGGLGGGIAEYCMLLEEIGRHGLVPPQITIQGLKWLLDWGTPAQRERYERGMATGEIIFSESISEPGVGSSLKLMQATAKRDGSGWRLSGSKTHVNLGHECDVTVFYAMADEGLTAFWVDMDRPGITTRQTDPIGGRSVPTADVVFDDVVVEDETILGEVGGGMATFHTTFNTSRLGNASEMIGIARRALTLAIDYASTREVGDNVVTEFQGIQWIVANCYADLYAASLLRNRAANEADKGNDVALLTSLVKKMAIDASDTAANEVFALVGGYGLYTDTPFSQLLQDMKVQRTAGGSLEVLRNYVARRVLRSETLEGLR